MPILKNTLKAETVGELIEALKAFPTDMPIAGRVKAAEYHMHPEGNHYYTFCYGEGRSTSKYGCCDRARQMKLNPVVKVLRLWVAD